MKLLNGLLVVTLTCHLADATLSKTDSKKTSSKSLETKTRLSDVPVQSRGLVTTDIKAKDIVLDHQSYCSKKVKERHVSGDVLGYVTPWNGRGYDVAKIFAPKLTLISPVWLQIRRKGRQSYQVTGLHDVDQGWIKDIRKSSKSTQIVPRVLFDSWSYQDFESVFSSEDEIEDLSDALVQSAKDEQFDGFVMEVWSQLGGQKRQELVHMLTHIGQALHQAKLQFILVIPPAVAPGFHIMSSSSPESDRSGFFYGSASPTGMENSPQHHSPLRSPTLTTSIMADEDTLLQEESCSQGTTMDTTHSQVTSQTKKSKKRSNAQAEKGNKSTKKKKYVEYAVDPTDFTTEGVIELVQSHTSLWDKEDPRHSDVVYNRKKWDEIYLALFPEFDSYGKKLQKTIMDLIQKRWRNVRDSYFKHLRETNLPSGSGARKSTYKYSDRLSFLHKVQELRQTTSNTAVPLTIQEEHVEQPSRFEDDDPSNATPTGAISSGVRLQRHGSRRSRDSQRDSLLLEAVQKLEETCTSKFLHTDVRLLRLEGMVTGHPPSPSKDFLMTLVPQMERMSEEQQSNYKTRLIKVTQECVNYTPPPPSQSPMYPQASPSVQLSRQRNYTSNYPPRYEDTFEEDGQIYRRV